MHPAQVLDIQADMIARASQPGFKELIHVQTMEDLQDGDLYHDKKKMASELSRDLAHRLEGAASNAYAYYVAPEMTDLIIWAAAGLDSTDRFRFDEVPTEYGFAYFDKPVEMYDARGAKMLIHLVVWMPIWVNIEADRSDAPVPGTAFYMFNDYNNQPDEIGQSLIDKGFRPEKYGRWGLIGIQSISEDQRIGPESIGLTEHKRQELIAEGAVPTEFTNLGRLMRTGCC